MPDKLEDYILQVKEIITNYDVIATGNKGLNPVLYLDGF